MPRRRATSALACLAAVALAIAGCGSSDSTETTAVEAGGGKPAPPKSAFPSARGKSLVDVLNSTAGPAEVVVSPAARTFYAGENRYPFGVFRPDRTPIADAEVALYIAKVPPPKKGGPKQDGKQRKGPQARARQEALEAPARGPFPAAIESIDTKAAYRSRTTAADENAPNVVYVSNLDFPSNGEWRIAAAVKQEGEVKATLLPSAVVGEIKRVPRPGQQPPRIHTPTASDVGGNLEEITTRVPPDTQNQVDFADALGREPIALLFATPQFCESRVCGPVVDVAEQVKDSHGDEVAFIHMEIYNDNDPSKGVRPQVRAFHLPSEPWLFVIDRNGTVRDTVEGAFGVKRMTEAIEKVTGGG